MDSTRDAVRCIAREEVSAYLERMRLLEEMNSSKIEVRPAFFHRREPWEISRFLARSPKNPESFVGVLLKALRRRGLRFSIFLEGCNGRDVKPFRGRVKHGYDFVCKLLDLSPLELRLHLKRISEFESKTYLIARYIRLAHVEDVLDILNEVEEEAPDVSLCLGSRKREQRMYVGQAPS